MGGRAGNRGGRGRRGGGRRGGRGGRAGGRKTNGGAPPPPPPPPTGEALLLTLTTSSSAFHDAVSQLPTPFIATQDDNTITLTEWNKQNLIALLSWFSKGLDSDPDASLSFSPLLNKHNRAQIHSAVDSNGLGSLLKTISQGVGDSRSIIVVSRKNNKVNRPKTDPITTQNALWLRRWVKEDQGILLSQDEAVELMSQGEDTFPIEFKKLWEERLPCQLTCHSLCMAAAFGDIQAAEHALSANPLFDLSSTSHMTEVESGDTPLHVAAAENQGEFIDWMIGKGATTAGVNAKGQTAYEVARKMEKCDAEGVFVRLGAAGTTTNEQQQQQQQQQQVDLESNSSTCGSSTMAYQNCVVSGTMSVKSNIADGGGDINGYGNGNGGELSTRGAAGSAAAVGEGDKQINAEEDMDGGVLPAIPSIMFINKLQERGWLDVEVWKKWGKEHRQDLVSVATVVSSCAVAGVLLAIASRRRDIYSRYFKV